MDEEVNLVGTSLAEIDRKELAQAIIEKIIENPAFFLSDTRVVDKKMLRIIVIGCSKAK